MESYVLISFFIVICIIFIFFANKDEYDSDDEGYVPDQTRDDRNGNFNINDYLNYLRKRQEANLAQIL